MKQNKAVSFPLLAGHIVECFDNTLYGFFAVMLAPVFFPAHDAGTQLLASYGAFAAGYLARPFGAIVFGFLGDKKGRKLPLVYAIGLVGIPTLTIGLNPGYSSIGYAAPALLIICRLLQGFFMGGEFTGANLFISESQNQRVLGTQTGILISSGVFGAVAATGLGALFTMELMPSWAWRIPFIFGGITALFVFFLRYKLEETPEFQKVKHRKSILDFPWKILVEKYKLKLVLACLIAGLTIAPLYLTTIYGNKLFREIGYSTSESMLLNLAAMVFNGIIIIYSGRLADIIGFQKQMFFGASTTALIAFPAFFLIAGGEMHILNVYLFISTLVASGCIINGCAMPYIASLFPTNCRYSGVAVSVTTGQALFGGTTPLVASYLTDLWGTNLAPAVWLFTIAVITGLGIWLNRKNTSKLISAPIYNFKPKKVNFKIAA